MGVGSEETTPFADSPLIELEPHERNDRVRRYEMQRLVSDFKDQGQPMTSEVRSSGTRHKFGFW